MSRVLSVSEFAEVSHMPESTIRYYSKLGLLPPVMRGENKYRYFSRKQVAHVNVIRTFQELGLPLSEIRSAMTQRSPQYVIDLLGRQSKVINGNMTKLADAGAFSKKTGNGKEEPK